VKTKQQERLEIFRVRLSKHENEKLRAYAYRRGYTASHVIREYIRRLPNVQGDSFITP